MEKPIKLLKIVKSHNPKKKWDANFLLDNNKEKIVSFGAVGYQDYTQHKNPLRKMHYIQRHHNRLEDWNNPLTPASLSRYILWEYTDIKKAIQEFKKRFHLQ